jgi:hypothetical protein
MKTGGSGGVSKKKKVWFASGEQKGKGEHIVTAPATRRCARRGISGRRHRKYTGGHK